MSSAAQNDHRGLKPILLAAARSLKDACNKITQAGEKNGQLVIDTAASILKIADRVLSRALSFRPLQSRPRLFVLEPLFLDLVCSDGQTTDLTSAFAVGRVHWVLLAVSLITR